MAPLSNPSTSKAPVVTRPAAALVVISGDRVLMVKRPDHFTYPGAFVFPGGTVSSGESLEYTALRETFEETGLVLSSSPIPDTKRALLPSLQKAVHDNKLSFDSALQQLGVSLIPTSDLLGFSTWTTPHGPPKRYETHFFITRLPPHIAPESVRRDGDGGIEVIGAHWLPAHRIPGWVREGKTTMHSAQIYLTARLASSLPNWEAVKAVSKEIESLDVMTKRSEEGGKRVETLPNGHRVVYDIGARSAGKAWVEIRSAGKARL